MLNDDDESSHRIWVDIYTHGIKLLLCKLSFYKPL
jgi:hypothetical protein